MEKDLAFEWKNVVFEYKTAGCRTLLKGYKAKTLRYCLGAFALFPPEGRERSSKAGDGPVWALAKRAVSPLGQTALLFAPSGVRAREGSPNNPGRLRFGAIGAYFSGKKTSRNENEEWANFRFFGLRYFLDMARNTP